MQMKLHVPSTSQIIACFKRRTNYPKIIQFEK
jgi:hypothetical protein